MHALNAYCYRCPLGKTYPSCEVACAKDVEATIQTTTSGQIAAFLAEPIQGVGGFITPPKEYFKIVFKIVKDYGGLFIADPAARAWSFGEIPVMQGAYVDSRIAPDVEVPDRKGRPVRLSQFRGKKVLLVTWASW